MILMRTGIVNVSAKDLGTGHEQSITITSSSNMSEEEIKKEQSGKQKFTEVKMPKNRILSICVLRQDSFCKILSICFMSIGKIGINRLKTGERSMSETFKAIGRSTPEKIDEVTASNICEAKDYLENTLRRMGI